MNVELFLITVILISVFVTLCIYAYLVRYTYKLIPKLSQIIIILSIYITFQQLTLILVDIEISKREILINLYEIWYTIFVLTQVLSWIILPILQSYDLSGELTIFDKLKDAIKDNGKLYLILASVGIILLIYIVYISHIYILNDIIGIAVSLSNTLGMILLIIYLSYGLVKLPESLFMNLNGEKKRNKYYYELGNLENNLEITMCEIKECEKQIDSILTKGEIKILSDIKKTIEKTQKSFDKNKYAEDLIEKTYEKDELPKDEVTMTRIIEINKKVKIYLRIFCQYKIEYETKVKKCYTIMSRKSRNIDMIIICYVSLLMSLFVIMMESMIPFQLINSKSPIDNIINNNIVRFPLLTLILTYMCACTFWAFYYLKIPFLEEYLITPQTSDAAKLCFSFGIITRIILPLCYNMVWMSNMRDNNNLSYIKFYGYMDMVINNHLNYVIPIFIPLTSISIYFNVFYRILKKCDLDVNYETEDFIENGKKIMSQYNDKMQNIQV